MPPTTRATTPRAVGRISAADAHPMATMHCSVIFLQGDFSGVGMFAISMQSMDIDTCAEPMLVGAGIIAVAVDWPVSPSRAVSNMQMWSSRVTMR